MIKNFKRADKYHISFISIATVLNILFLYNSLYELLKIEIFIYTIFANLGLFFIYTLFINSYIEKLESKVSKYRVKFKEKSNLLDRAIERERVLMQKSRVAQMGEMISSIAHQWRQPLNALGILIQKHNIDYKRDRVDKNSVSNMTKESMQLINSMSTTIDNFRNLFYPNIQKERFNIVDLIESILKLIDITISTHNIKIELNISQNREEFEIFSYKNELSQVLLNLLNNSKDAIVENSIAEPKIEISILRDKNSDEFFKIEIIDNGGGIDKNLIDKIFNPYFSTKDEGKGSGVGLYMSKLIVENHIKGEIGVDSRESKTKFYIKLPTLQSKRSLDERL